MTWRVIAMLVMVGAALAPGDARAEHLALAPEARPAEPAAAAPAPEGAPRLGGDADVTFRVGRDGFRLGGRVSGQEGVYGAWLNGHLGRDRLSVDGRVQADRRAYNFRFDSWITDPLGRRIVGWWLGGE
jgi:hypothetical protein